MYLWWDWAGLRYMGWVLAQQDMGHDQPKRKEKAFGRNKPIGKTGPRSAKKTYFYKVRVSPGAWTGLIIQPEVTMN